MSLEAKLKTELTTETSKATLDVQKASDKMSASLNKVTKSAKNTADETGRITKGLDESATKSLKFMEAMSKANAVIGLARAAMDWGQLFIDAQAATDAQVATWERVTDAVNAAKTAAGGLVVLLTQAATLNAAGAISDFERREREIAESGGDSPYEVAQRIAAMREKSNKAIREREAAAQLAMEIARSETAEALREREEKAAEYRRNAAEKAHAAWKRRMAEVLAFQRGYADAMNDPRLKNARIESILGGEPTGNLQGLIDDNDPEGDRRQRANERATDEARDRYDAAQINQQIVEAEVEGYRSRIAAAVEFMKMDRAQKRQWLKDTGTEEAIKAGAYLGEALFFTATGNPAAAGMYAASAQHAAMAVACGVGVAAMGGGGRGSSAGAAGGGYSTPAGSSGGGSVTYIVNVSGVLGDKEDVGEYVSDAVKKAHAQGRAVSGDAGGWD